MKQKQFLLVFLIILLGAVIIGSAFFFNRTPVNNSNKITIAATFYPLYDFTRSIAGNVANVYSVVPLNADPHEYETSPQDLVRLNQANVFITLGVQKGFAPYEEQLIQTVSKNITIIAAGNGIQQITPKGEFGDVSDDLNYNGLDPHIWVSPKEAIVMVKNIEDGLVTANPVNAETYKQNAQILLNNLDALDKNYTQGLSNCSQHVILAGHDAYSYLARDYGFKSYYVDGLSTDQEPTPQQIARLVDVAKQYNLKYIFYETSVDPKVSNVIASQVGATTIPMTPFESTNDPSITYIQAMEQNLKNLEIGLECH